jgi:transposase InsO family protein
MTKKLISMGHDVNHKKISRIMRENGLNSVVRRKKYRPEVYERRKLLKETVPENILQRNFYSSIPRTIFVTDITYLYTSKLSPLSRQFV